VSYEGFRIEPLLNSNHPCSHPCRAKGEFDSSEGTSANWILDVEIEKFRAEALFLHVEKTKIMLEVCEKLLMNTASKLGPHTQTDRGTCPGVGL
jgi:hypothetical protein